MTTAEAKKSLGKEFTLNFVKLNYSKRKDVIRSVKPDGTIVGDFIEAPADSCRLINDKLGNHLKTKS